jgi:branched-chain amino acid transport system substrate-binding protein
MTRAKWERERGHMSTNSRRFTSVGVLLVVMAAVALLAFFAAGCGGGGTTSTEATSSASAGGPVAVKEWDLSMLSVLSGPVAFAGEPALWGAQYAAEQINASGGIRGVPVKITGVDTAFDPAKAASAMTTACENGLIVLGPMDGPSAAAAAPVFVDAQVPVVAALTSPQERANALPYGVAYMIDDGPPTAWAVDQWLKLQPEIKKLVVFWDPSDPANKIEMEETVKSFEAAGATEAGSIEIKAGQLDMGTPAVKALSYNADGYVCLVRMEEFAKLAVELNDRGMKDGWRLYAPFAAFGSDLLNLAKGSLEGAYIWNKLDITSQDPAWLKFVDAYKADHAGQEPVVPPVLGYYDTLNALKQIFEKYEITGDPAKLAEERQKITEGLADGTTYDGLQFKWKWQDGQMMGSAFLYQVQNGKFAMVAEM